MARKAFKQYQRDPNALPLRLTERDIQVFSYLWNHRLLRADHLYRVMNAHAPYSLQRVRRRLRALYDNGYLERFYFEDRDTPGSRPMTYALTDKGARVLAKEGLIEETGRMNEKNKRLKDSTQTEHMILVAAILTAIEAACLQSDDLTFIFEETLRDGWQGGSLKIESKESPKPKYRAIPDAVFGIRYAQLDNKASYYFLEADRGSEMQSPNPNKTTIHGKAEAYYQIYEQYRPSRHYPPFELPNFRVLFLTDKAQFARQDRLEGLITTCQKVARTPLFLFGRLTTESDFDQILDLPLLEGKDKRSLSLRSQRPT